MHSVACWYRAEERRKALIRHVPNPLQPSRSEKEAQRRKRGTAKIIDKKKDRGGGRVTRKGRTIPTSGMDMGRVEKKVF